MAEYKAPVRDMQFVMKEVMEVQKLWASLPALADVVDEETADAILEEAGKIAADVIAPINREGDEIGTKFIDGTVTPPPGFKEAYDVYSEGGWNGLGGNPEFGGMGMPKTLVAQVEEMMQAACMSFSLAPMLTTGAAVALNAHGSDELKNKYLPNLYAGTWSGAMDLTEPHAGTDLGIIRTKAEPEADGSYRITGTKIFITWGEHDMSENIIHLVLARMPDAPAGVKGISMFLVPRFLVNDDGTNGEANGLACGSLEKKMGIKASPTCVMNYDGSKGWLVGEANQGLATMFTMMNYERLAVGIQGLACAEASFQNALEYAKDRLQSRAMTGPVAPDKAADPIIVHSDVRRMLLTMKGYVEGGRAFSTYVAKWLDIQKFGDDAEAVKQASAMIDLLTPVVKAFETDKGFEAAVLGQQVFGGHGYIREWGQEQFVRDARIAQIYEGTNGIQSMDLMGRKVVMNGGATVKLFAAEIENFIAEHSELIEFVQPLKSALDLLLETTEFVVSSASNNPNEIGAAAVEYLHQFGHTAYAFMWAKMAAVALQKQGDSFYDGKVATARFYMQRLLPQVEGLARSIKAGGESIDDMDADWF
ncbi:MAG: acyl-CoA dehydrogenase C-terminal domain-containing protein [Cellvibrionaceae bacterium]